MGATKKLGVHAFLVQFSDAVRGKPCARVVADTACRMLAEELAADRAHWAEVDWSAREYVVASKFVAEGLADTVGGRYPLEAWEPVTSKVLAGQTTLTTDRTSDDTLPDSVKEGMTRVAVAARIAVPVMSEGRLRAVLSVNQASPREWTPEEIALVEGVAARCWAEVERTRAETALRESEKRMRLAMRATRMVTWEWTPAEDRIATSENFAEVYGLATLASAREGFALVLPGDVEAHAAKVARIVASGGTYESEFRIRRPSDGRVVWIEERAEALVGPTGAIERVVGIAVDITARKDAEARLRETEERQSFLLALSDALRPLADADAPQEVAGRMLGERLGCGWAYYAEWDTPPTTMTVRHCHARAGLPSLAGAHPVSSLELIAPFLAGTTVIVPDMTTHPLVTEDNRARFARLGMRSFAGVPVGKPGGVRALFVVADTVPRAWTEAEMALVEAVAERTWTAVVHARAEDVERVRHALDERQAFFLTLSDALRPLSDALEIQRAAMRIVGERLHVDRVLFAEFESDGREYVIADNHVAPGVPRRVGRFPTQVYSTTAERLARGETSVITDMTRTALMPAAEREAAVAAGLLAVVGVPLLDGGKLVAQLSVQHLRPRDWTPTEISILQETAERTWAAVQRARAQEALRRGEEHLRLAMEAARFFSWELDPRARRSRSAPDDPDAALAFVPTGEARETMSRIREHVFPEDAAKLSAAFERTIAGEGDLHAEFRAKHPATGETLWFESHATLVGGARTRVSGITRDVTDQKRIEEERRTSAEAHTFSLELSDALRPLLDPLAIKELATRRLRDHLDVAWCAYGRIDETRDVARIVRDATRAGLPSLVGTYELSRLPELTGSLGAGSVLAIADLHAFPGLEPEAAERYAALGLRAVLAAPILEEGRPVAMVLLADTAPRAWTASETELLRDVAERTWVAVGRARAETVLRASETRLQLADRTKDEFLATLGHELRTPLAAILLWGGALRSGELPASEHARAFEAIVECATAQSLLIDDLLDLSRLVTGKLRLAPESSAVGDVALGIADIVRPMSNAKKLTLVTDVPSDLGRAELDPARLRQVLWNLLSNGIKFTLEGGTVTLTVRRTDGHLEVVVSDTGEGIAPAFAEHLFERFRQADMGESRRHGGLGIGLALCRELVELQGGTITAESGGPGRGSTFRVRLPWVAGRTGSSAPPHARGSARSFSPPLQGVTVVLVEDEPHTRRAMESTLGRAGATVLAVSTGQAALEALAATDETGAPVVLVSDVGLPGMTDYELVARAASMRTAEGRAPVPACAVSSHARDTDRQRAIDAGFDVYVAKPVTPEDLVEAVTDLVPMAGG